MTMSRRQKIAVFAPLAILGIALFVTVGGLIVRWLWNALLPELFGVPTIGFWQALGLLALARILFGGLGTCHRRGSGGAGSHFRDRWQTRWQERVAERWEQMTPEERDRLRQRLRGFDATETVRPASK
jgi:hypothetical protein